MGIEKLLTNIIQWNLHNPIHELGLNGALHWNFTWIIRHFANPTYFSFQNVCRIILLYISLSALCIKKVNNFNKSNMLDPNFALLNLPYVNLLLFIYIYKRQNIYVCMYVCMYVLTSPPRLLNRIQPNFACPKLPWHPE